MKTYIFSLALIVLCVARLAVAQESYDYCIHDVNIIRPELSTPLIRHQDVFILKNRIAVVTVALATPPKNCLHLIDGTGKFLLPGLTDMHVHLPSEQIEKFMLMNLAAGVTTIRSMRGKPTHIELRRKLASGEMVGPDLYIATPYFPNKNITIDHLADSIKAFKAAGYDLIKVLAVPDSIYFETLMKAANEIGMPVAGHAVWQIPIDRLIESGYGCLEHLQDLDVAYDKDTSLLPPLIEKIKKHNMFNCPSIDFYNVYWDQVPLAELKQRAGVEYIDQKDIEDWTKEITDHKAKFYAGSGDSVTRKTEGRRTYIQSKLKIIKKLNDLGAKMIMSPASAYDAFCPPGFCVWEELKLFAKAGIANKDILKIATYNAADYFHETDTWGSIAPGQKANLLLLNKNPLESIENITSQEGIFLRGHYMTSKTIAQSISKK